MRIGPPRCRAAIVAAVAIVAVAGVGIGLWATATPSVDTAAKTTFAVRTGTLTVTTSASGAVEPVDSRALTFGTDGTVRTLTVKAGDHVTAGATLATLDATDAQAAVSSAQSALDAANSNLTLAEQQSQQPAAAPARRSACASGTDIVLATSPAATPSPAASPSPAPSPSPRPSPSGQPSPSGRASPSGQASPSKRATMAPVPTGTRGCGSGTGSGGGPALRSGSGSADQSTGTDSLMRAQQAVNNAQLALEQADARLAGTTIVAPSDGRILSVAGSVGQSVSAGGSGFIVMGGVDSLAIEAQFSEADVAAVAVGQKATVTLADHPGVGYDATVVEIDPAGTATGQLVRFGVRLEFTHPPADLLLGQSAVAAVVTATASNVLYVPSAALSNVAGNTATVEVHTTTGNATRRVTLGLAGDQGTQIDAGLAAGDVVVVPTN